MEPNREQIAEFAKIIRESCLEDKNGGPFGAVVFKDGEVVGVGFNQVTSLKDPTAHAEIQAIRDACQYLDTFDLSGCELYASGFPCPMCMSAIAWANIKKVYYSATYEDAEEIGFRDRPIYDFIKSEYKNGLIELKQVDKESIINIYREFEKEGERY